MTPDPHPIRGFVELLPETEFREPDVWLWHVYLDEDRTRLAEFGQATTLPAAYDRCAAAVRQARGEEAS